MDFDRRYIFLLVGVVLVFFLYVPFSLEMPADPDVKSYFEAIESLKPGDIVVVATEYSPATEAEQWNMHENTLFHLFAHDIKVINISTWETGPDIMRKYVEKAKRLVKEQLGKTKVRDVDYTELAYTTGREIVMVTAASSIAEAFPKTREGRATSETEIMKGVAGLAPDPVTGERKIKFLIDFASGNPGTREWIRISGRPAGRTAVRAVAPQGRNPEGAFRDQQGHGDPVGHPLLDHSSGHPGQYQFFSEEKAGGGLMSLEVSVSYFIAAFLTLAIFSFLYKDNPVYKFAEHLFVGVAAGYYFIVAFRDSFMTHFWNYLAEEGDPWRWIRVGSGVMGVLIVLHLWPRLSWLARWPIAFLVGAYAGLRLVGAMQAEVLVQVDSLMTPVWREGMKIFSFREESLVGNVLIVVGVLTVLMHFFFSAERGPVLRAVSRVGVIFLMVTFGAAFGFTVLGRVSLLIGRARDLQKFENYGHFTTAAAVLVISSIVAWEVYERMKKAGAAAGEEER